MSCLGGSALHFSILVLATNGGCRGRLRSALAVDRRGIGLSVIVRRLQSGILFRCCDARALCRGWREVLCFRCGLFLRRGLGSCAARAVEAGAAAGIYDLVVDVGVVNHSGVHPGHSCVIPKNTAGPCAAVIAGADVAKAVVDPAVETHGWAPVALVE